MKLSVRFVLLALLATWEASPASAVGAGYGVNNPTCDGTTIPKDAFRNAENYCDANLYGGFFGNVGTKHTMCTYQSLGKSCTNVCQFGLSQVQKQAILNKHNELRRKVAKGLETRSKDGKPQPKAANMWKMEWDDELEAIAMRWTAQCTPGHDKVRGTRLLTYVGQNGYFSSSSRLNGNFDATAAATSWYSEVNLFTTTNINPFVFDYPSGHYSQLVWANSNRLGCALIQYKANGFYNTNIFCNYGPGGNFLKASMYEVGETASKCNNANGSDDGLCK